MRRQKLQWPHWAISPRGDGVPQRGQGAMPCTSILLGWRFQSSGSSACACGRMVLLDTQILHRMTSSTNRRQQLQFAVEQRLTPLGVAGPTVRTPLRRFNGLQ